MKKKQNKTELATTNAKLYEDSKIAELYVKKTAPLIDKIIMKKRNPIPIVHCAILGQVHDEELSISTKSRMRLLGPLRLIYFQVLLGDTR